MGMRWGASRVAERGDEETEERLFRQGALRSSQRHTAGAHGYGWLAMAVVVVLAFVVPIVLWRPMDGDEGYYAMASKLVAHGKAPYADFWFQQAPLLPYVYGTVVRMLGTSWYVLRGTSALWTLLLGAAIAAYGLRRWRSPVLAFLAVTLFITTPLAFEWFPTVKTYALSTLLLFGAYVAADTSSRRSWVAAGVLLGLAIDTRLLFATTVVVFALYAGRHLLAFAAGLLAGLLPLVVFFVGGPARFVNDAVASQTMRSHSSLDANLTQKIHSLGGVLAEPHVLALSVAAFAIVLSSVHVHRRIPMVVAIAFTLVVTNVIPTPSYQQYFVTVIPFLVIAAVDLVAQWHLSSSSVAGIALVAVLVGALVPSGIVPAVTSGVVPRSRLNVDGIRTTSSAIDTLTAPGEVVLAFWPGFLFNTHARPLPGLESDFEARALRDTRLSPARAKQYHMLSADGVVNAITTHWTHLIVLGHGDLSGAKPWRSIVLRAGYRAVDRLQSATLYEYDPPIPSGQTPPGDSNHH
jgi:hypothetical protein